MRLHPKYRLTAKYSATQPRIPSGNPDGGQWTSGAYSSIHGMSLEDYLGEKTTPHNDGYGKSGNSTYKLTEAASDFHDQHGEKYSNYMLDTANEKASAAYEYRSLGYTSMNLYLRHPELVKKTIEASNNLATSAEIRKIWADAGMEKMWDRYGFSGKLDTAVPKIPNVIRAIDEDGLTLPKGTTLYRSFRNVDLLAAKRELIGSTFTEKAFLSTSLNARMVSGWNTSANPDRRERAILRIKGDGARGLYMPKHNGNPYESEILLRPNTKLKITRLVKLDSGEVVLDAEIVDTAQKADASWREIVVDQVPVEGEEELQHREDKFTWDELTAPLTFPVVAKKYDPNQPRVPAGSAGGGRWTSPGGGGGFSVSDKYMNELLGLEKDVDAPDNIPNPAGRSAEPAAWAAYERIMQDEDLHDYANGMISGVELYQSAYYQAVNYALRFPDEWAAFEAEYYALSSEGEDEWANAVAWTEAAWEAAGLEAVTGKLPDDLLVSGTDLTGSLYLADEMASGMRQHAPVLPENVKLYRSFRHPGLLEKPESYVGKTFTEDGFSSTSLSASFAAKWNTRGRSRALMRITTNGEVRGLHLTRQRYGEDKDPYEFEVLLPAGTSYRITQITKTPTGDILVDAVIDGATASKADRRSKRLGRNPDPVELGEPNPDKFGWSEIDMRHLFLSLKYDPNQPRAPAGSSIGGQWVSSDGFNASAGNAVFEVAPHPDDKVMKGRWEKLSNKEKIEVSRAVLKKLTPEVAKELGITKYDLVEHVGGWMGDVNPSYTMKALTGKDADAAARLLGYGLQQEGMMLLSSKAFPGSFPASVVGIDLAGGGPDTARKVYGELSKLKKPDGSHLVQGFTMRNGRMEILHDSDWTGLNDNKFYDRVVTTVDKAFDNKYGVAQTTAYAGFLGEGDYTHAPDGLAKGVADWRGRADRVRSAAQKALEEELGRRGKAAERYKLRVKYNPNQPRAPAGAANGGQWVPAGSGVAGVPGSYGPHDSGWEKFDGQLGKDSVEQGYFILDDKDNPDTPAYDPVKGNLTDELGLASHYTTETEVANAYHDEHASNAFTYRQNLPNDDYTVLREYQEDYYRLINDYALERMDAEPDDWNYKQSHRDRVESLDRTIANGPKVPAGTTLYRTFRSEDVVKKAPNMVGQVFREKRFLSTSVNAAVPYNWAHAKDSPDGLTVLRMRTTRDTAGLYLTRTASLESYEYEVLMPRNTAFRINRVSRIKLGNGESAPVTVIDADIVHPEETDGSL